MADNFKSLLIGMMLTSLFLVAMFTFATTFAINNNLNTSLVDDEILNDTYTELYGNLTTIRETTNTQFNATESDPTTEGSDSLILVSTWGTIKSYFSIIKATGNSILELLYKLGISPIVLAVILSIIGITIIFLGWRAIRQGE